MKKFKNDAVIEDVISHVIDSVNRDEDEITVTVTDWQHTQICRDIIIPNNVVNTIRISEPYEKQ